MRVNSVTFLRLKSQGVRSIFEIDMNVIFVEIKVNDD